MGSTVTPISDLTTCMHVSNSPDNEAYLRDVAAHSERPIGATDITTENEVGRPMLKDSVVDDIFAVTMGLGLTWIPDRMTATQNLNLDFKGRKQFEVDLLRRQLAARMLNHCAFFAIENNDVAISADRPTFNFNLPLHYDARGKNAANLQMIVSEPTNDNKTHTKFVYFNASNINKQAPRVEIQLSDNFTNYPGITPPLSSGEEPIMVFLNAYISGCCLHGNDLPPMDLERQNDRYVRRLLAFSPDNSDTDVSTHNDIVESTYVNQPKS